MRATASTVTCTIDGREVQVEQGRTAAAALMLDAQQAAWRTTRRAQDRRGLFCGIGVCFDCLLTIDGRTGMRGCLVEVADGMDIRTDRTALPDSGGAR